MRERKIGRLVRGAAATLVAAAVLCAAPPARAGVSVRIEGNAALDARSLREAASAELERLSDPARRPAAADDAAFQMESAGRHAGYAFIEVTSALSGAGDDVTAVFTVREGPLVRLAEVTFAGNAFFPAERLRPLVAAPGTPPYVEADLREGRREVAQLYRDEGFADAQVTGPHVAFSEDRTRASVRFDIVEGTRRVIRAVVFEGDSPQGDADALRQLAASLPGQPYFERRKLGLANGVTGVFGARGYPEATATVRDEPGGTPGEVLLRVTTTSGPRVRVTGIAVGGNKRTRTSFILARIPLKPGDWYNEESVHEGIRQLYRTGVVTRVAYTLEGAGTGRVLRLTVEEAPAREFSVQGGWGSYERLRGAVAFRDRNVLGVGLGASAEVGASTKSRYVTTELLAPQVAGTDVSLSLPLSWSFREEPAFNEEKVEVSARLYRIFAGRVAAGVKYGFDFDHLTHLSADVPLDARDRQVTLASVSANVEIDRRDDIFYPTRGWQSAGAVQLADRRMGGSLDFLRCTAGGKFFRPLGAGFVLGLRLDTGFIVPTRGSTDIPVNERFFTGGESSVRSFKEQELGPKGPAGDPLGGLASTVASVEVRRPIVGHLAGSVFVDAGNVSPNGSLAHLGPDATNTSDYVAAMWSDYLRDFRTGVGFGLQYLTPLGPIRVDAAWNPSPRPSEFERRFVTHLSIGMAF
ncbi:MAG TPA: BamA/TamA family outer membrane protein [bacterium]